MTWVIAIAGLHVPDRLARKAEHFLAAKAGRRMRVERFSLFFPPRVAWLPPLARPTYQIGALPLGGYVKITGMTPGGAPRASTCACPIAPTT